MGSGSSRSPRIEPGPTFAVRGKLYRYLGLIGRGGEATVHLCEDQSAKQFAAKVFDFSRYPPSQQGQRIRNFLKQARIMKYLSRQSEHFIHLYNYDYDRLHNVGYMIMELSNGSLRDYLRSGQPLNPTQCKQNWTQIVTILKELEDANIVHADIKPENILIVDGILKLTDLGLAFQLDSSQEISLRGGIRGTLDYMAPEVFRYRTGYQSDVWSAGIILYEMTYGRAPFFDIMDRQEKVGAIVNTFRIPIPPHPDRTLKNCIRRCLQYRVSHRATTGELLEHPYFWS